MRVLSEQDIIRAWKDEEYRESLSEAQRAQLPENPVGAVELPDSELNSVVGARWKALKKAGGWAERTFWASYLACGKVDVSGGDGVPHTQSGLANRGVR